MKNYIAFVLALALLILPAGIYAQAVPAASGALETAKKNDLIAAEMESFGLFATAKNLGKKAACILTVSDNIITHVETTAEERQSKLLDMIRIALEAVEEE